MKNRRLLGIMLVGIALLSITAPHASAETLVKTDFEQESFAKTVDYFDYVRTYASLHGVDIPEGFDDWHANMYMTYINNSGLKILYAGLDDITFGNEGYLRIPMQSFIMHYKTQSENDDVILSSTFLMLMAFNESSNTDFVDSPDTNDVLYASFSMGFDTSAFGAVRPVLNSKTETIPLTSKTVDNKLVWEWGMKYSNLTALWWRTWIDPTNPHYENSWPLAMTTYDELTFTYTLTIDPVAGTATLQENHVIGRMRDLIVGVLPLLWVYYNSTGTYDMLGKEIGDETIYDYIDDNGLKMSLVNFQTTVTAQHETYSSTAEGRNVDSAKVEVSDTSIDTFTDVGEKIFNADFGTKPNYQLFNYTEDPSEIISETYASNVATASAAGFSGNAGLFAYHIGLMKFLPLVVVHMYPALYAKSALTLSDVSKANYFYLISYPEYGGYRVVHDPTFTAYFSSPESASSNNGGIVLLIAIIAIVAVVAAVFVLKRKPRSEPDGTSSLS